MMRLGERPVKSATRKNDESIVSVSHKPPKGLSSIGALGSGSFFKPCLERDVKWVDITHGSAWVGNTASTCNTGRYYNTITRGHLESNRLSEAVFQTALRFRISFYKPPTVWKVTLPATESADGITPVDNTFKNWVNDVVRVVWVIDQNSQSLASNDMPDWYGANGDSPGVFASDSVDAMADDRFESRYRIIYDETFPINEISSGTTAFTTTSDGSWPASGIVRFMTSGVNTFFDASVNLNGLESRYDVIPGRTMYPYSNGLMCFVRSGNPNAGAHVTSVKINARVEFTDAS